MKPFKNKLVELDKQKAKQVSKLVEPLKFAHYVGYNPQKINRESDLFLWYIIVGICHQINWVFLIKALDQVRIKTPEKFTPQYLAEISHKELTSWLSAYPKKERLSKKMKRVELVRNLTQFLLKKYQGQVLSLVQKTSCKMGGKNGMYDLLLGTVAYGEDPLRKKATVFIELADELGLIEFSDWENYIPPIDYHIARIFLRTGVVKILDQKLFEKLMAYQPATKKEDLAIRQACIDAIIFIAGKNFKRRKKLQGIFWSIGRDCCHEDRANCENCQLKNCDCQKYLANKCGKNCFLKAACLAFNEDQSYLKIREQNFISTWY